MDDDGEEPSSRVTLFVSSAGLAPTGAVALPTTKQLATIPMASQDRRMPLGLVVVASSDAIVIVMVDF